jgi:hypothetical protein
MTAQPSTTPVLPPTAVRRPPRPSSGWATVTRLGSPRADRTAVPVATTQGTLALDPRGSAGMPATPELWLVEDRTGTGDGTGGASRADDTAEVERWSARFAQAVVEVIGGDRAVTQLLRWTSQRVYADLGRRVRVLSRSSGARQRSRTVRPQVRSVHVFRPTRESAEVSVHVRYGRRSRAIAARLELTQGRWQCTALELG